MSHRVPKTGQGDQAAHEVLVVAVVAAHAVLAGVGSGGQPRVLADLINGRRRLRAVLVDPAAAPVWMGVLRDRRLGGPDPLLGLALTWFVLRLARHLLVLQEEPALHDRKAGDAGRTGGLLAAGRHGRGGGGEIFGESAFLAAYGGPGRTGQSKA